MLWATRMPAHPTRITVAICTHNRAEQLPWALQSLCEADPPQKLDWEVLVVLNCCTDHTMDVVRAFAGRLAVRAVAEDRPGVSHARNRAVEAATGDWILWIDDDVRVSRGYLTAYEAALRRWPSASFLGGAIRPYLEDPTPPWLPAAMPVFKGVYGQRVVDNSTDTLIGLESLKPFGGNYATRTDVQRLYRYNPDLGRTPALHNRHGEETAVIKAMLKSGVEGRWVAGADVDHVVPVARQTLRYIRSYYLGHGKRRGLGATSRHRGVKMFGKDVTRFLAGEVRYRISRILRRPPARWARHFKHAATARGYLIGKYWRRDRVWKTPRTEA
jgi:glycosyltransferase involved in cell wall biosynthesis